MFQYQILISLYLILQILFLMYHVQLNQYYFHCINVYQSGFTDNQQDVSDFMEYNPTRDLIIKYDYHSPQFNERSN